MRIRKRISRLPPAALTMPTPDGNEFIARHLNRLSGYERNQRHCFSAIALARQLCAFPQATMNADRMSAYRQWDLPIAQALHQEWERGKQRIADGFEGAARFAGGEGRHGRF